MSGAQEKLKVYARAQPAIYVDHTNQTTSIIKPTRGTNPLRQRLWEPPAGSCPRRRLLFEDPDTRLGAAIRGREETRAKPSRRRVPPGNRAARQRITQHRRHFHHSQQFGVAGIELVISWPAGPVFSVTTRSLPPGLFCRARRAPSSIRSPPRKDQDIRERGQTPSLISWGRTFSYSVTPAAWRPAM